jgi:microcin C transport system substrate-binding protein
LVDATQYEQRQKDFDFDANWFAVSIGGTPTADLLETLYHSRAASDPVRATFPERKARRSTR